MDGVFRYRARTSSSELLRQAVSRFVEKSLGGSVTPFVAYLSETGKLSQSELEELVSKLQSERDKGDEP